MSANLKAIKDAHSAGVEIKDPETGAPTGVTIMIAGPEHPARKSAELDRARRMRARFQRTGKIELDDPEDQAAQGKEDVIAAVLGWAGYVDEGGAAVPFSVAAARDLIGADDMGWLRQQLAEAMGQRERFIKRSAKT